MQMEDFLLSLHSEDDIILNKIKTFCEICDDIFNNSPTNLKELLVLLLKKYKISIFEDNKNTRKDGETQTDNDVTTNTIASSDSSQTKIWNSENIADEVASVAKKNLEDNGFVYDESTGLYYDHKLQCYYNPEFKLYYYHQTGAYYYYDEESQSLKFYCTTSSETESPTITNNNISEPLKSDINNEVDEKEPVLHSNEGLNKTCQPSFPKKAKAEDHGYEMEEGECSDSDDEPKLPPGPVVIEAGPKTFEPDHSKHIAPCIRVLVKSSLLDNLKPGTLFIVTCTGGTLGREGDHDILIPDQLVSKLHSSFRYVYKEGVYNFEVVDMGSKNGTFLNGKRLSETLIKSEPMEISHGSIITVGSTDLLCHIHKKDETCSDCEAYNASNETEEKRIDLANALTIKEKYSQELGIIRKKFGIMNSAVAKYPAGYEDRSEVRRKLKGSSHSSEKTQSSSIDVAISKQNKGFALMTRMGWVEGTGLGKQNGTIEPIRVDSNEGTVGFGSKESPHKSNKTTMENKKSVIAKKTKERFELLN